MASAVAVVALLSPPVASADTGVAGSAGTDTSLPLTDSAATVAGRGPFADLRVTVNQTRHVINQAISVTWTGGRPPANQDLFGRENFLQIFQCWGEDDGTIPANPGPPPEQCQFGAEQVGGNFTPPGGAVAFPGRRISQSGYSTFDPAQGYVEPSTGFLWKPFRAVDGTVVDAQVVPLPAGHFNQFTGNQQWNNPKFDFNTTNEIDWARTFSDGKGSELFQADDGLHAPGLGCGQQSQSHPDGTNTRPRCWLVVVPRGTATEENPPDVISPASAVDSSPLAPAAWRNRIAVSLDFNPVDSPCAIGADERRIVGSELAVPAVTNWQPTLCSTPGSPPYAFGSVSDDQARRQLLSGVEGAPGMAVVPTPFDPSTLDPADPVVYAPLTLSGLVVGFNIERVAPPGPDGRPVDPLHLAGVRVAHLNLTPRLVAKLLAESYRSQLNFGGRPPSYDWLNGNPSDLLADPDFVQYNPEFTILTAGDHRYAAGLVVEAATSDAAKLLWKWVLADPEAAAWLAGTPDPWGMKANPRYSTGPANPSGSAFGDPVPNSFPENETYCAQVPDPIPGTSPPTRPRPLCMLDFTPYAASMESAAAETRAANAGAKTLHPAQDPEHSTADTWWGPDGKQLQGQRDILSVTDAASAQRYGLQVASLSRAGDDSPRRSFILPDQAGLLAGQQAMVPSPAAGVLQPDPATTVAGAYPLTMLTYAAVAPAHLDAAARRDYAAFVDYAAGPGQTPGLDFGQLVPGYAPLPDDLRAQGKAAAAAIRDGSPPPVAPSSAATAPPASAAPTPAGSAGSSSGGPSGRSGAGSTAPPVVAPLAPATTSPVAATRALSRMPVKSGRPGRTLRDRLGAGRFALPVILAVFLAAALGAFLLGGSRTRGAHARPGGLRGPRSRRAAEPPLP